MSKLELMLIKRLNATSQPCDHVATLDAKPCEARNRSQRARKIPSSPVGANLENPWHSVVDYSSRYLSSKTNRQKVPRSDFCEESFPHPPLGHAERHSMVLSSEGPDMIGKVSLSN